MLSLCQTWRLGGLSRTSPGLLGAALSPSGTSPTATLQRPIAHLEWAMDHCPLHLYASWRTAPGSPGIDFPPPALPLDLSGSSRSLPPPYGLARNSSSTRQLLDQNRVNPLAPFAMYAAFPRSDYYGASDAPMFHRGLHLHIGASHVHINGLGEVV